MKKVTQIISLFLFLQSFYGKSQNNFTDNYKVFHEIGYSVGNYNGFISGVNFGYKRKFSVHFELQNLQRKAESTPDDFHFGVFDGIFNLFTFGGAEPKDFQMNIFASAGMYFPRKSNSHFRFNPRLGMGYTQSTKPTNWQQSGEDLFTANYTYDFEVKHLYSFVITPAIEYSINHVVGFSLMPQLVLNEEETTAGVSLRIALGLLRAPDKGKSN